MTSPALTVLFLALVTSTLGVTIGRTADYDNIPESMKTSKLANKPNIRNMETSWTNVHNRLSRQQLSDNDIVHKYDEIYKENEDLVSNKQVNLKSTDDKMGGVRNFAETKVGYGKKYDGARKYSKGKRRVKREDDPCEPFRFRNPEQQQITHPRNKNNTDTYAGGMNCNTTIQGPIGTVIELTFVDMFHIEDHPDCIYDYLEIRDGAKGYSKEIETLCGHQFPRQIVTTGPFAWLKFVSDDTIEYEGFRINIAFRQEPKSHIVPSDCYNEPIKGMHGEIGIGKIKPSCLEESKGQALDVLWTINTPENTKIYLNFTRYELEFPNECEENVIQVFGSVLEYHAKLAQYCGSVANSVTSLGNEMYIRYFASLTARAAKKGGFNATFTAFRSLNPNKDDKCDAEEEFDCEDNTCIAAELQCDDVAHCRLKTDEDKDLCKLETTSMISQPHIMVILVIFCLILSGMSFIFLFKCIRKLYQDHKIIKEIHEATSQEHIRQSCEDRLDSLVGSRLTLDAKRLQSDSEPRASLERENHTNEMVKRQRSFSKHKPSSIDSDFIPDVPLDPEDEPWRRSVDQVPVITENVRIEHNGRTRRSDTSKKEESVRRSVRESEESKARERKEIRDVSVGAPDTKESGCQTRESLFQTETAPSSDGSGSNGPGFSTFGYSGATIARPSPPQTNTSEITIELLSQVPPHQPSKSHKKMSDRRPMSAETTRSAPDVIIVSKPIR
ncbi:neuropilin and tolloid-like protein 1 isoform X1 [Ostrinia furnacalis]|uniref:neuropilin and tolloid-like protein 1 isoform X1 n=1 Tax=Ostrinia furnacalis TaxID=93504 RepID=UPI00103F3005|nr:neuropilin and tolloid-like protein 1 isoform X1 [Ostrinia furnacalis]